LPLEIVDVGLGELEERLAELVDGEGQSHICSLSPTLPPEGGGQ
jgi:hypothetical protein